MPANYVEILVKSRDEAKPELDDLKRKLEELGREVATARANVDDKEAAAKLDKLQAKLLDLDHRTANPKIRMTGALRAEAEIHAVEASLDRLKRKADEAGGRGLIGRILFGGGGGEGGSGLLGGFGSLPGGAGAGELASNPYGLAALVGGVAALLPELLGLASGFAAAGAGAASFYALAKPTISNLTQDYKSLSSAQAAYTKAQDKAALDPSKANLKAEAAALENLRAVRRGMTRDEGSAAEGIARLSTEYHKLTPAFAPEVFKVFTAGRKLAGQLLPDIVPFARTFADVLSQLLGQASKFAGSKGFADWLKQFHSLEGPALAAIGHGIGQVVVQIGKLLTTMSAKDVVNAINLAFNVLSGTIDGLRHVIEAIMRSYDNVSRTMQRDSHDIAVSFDSMRHSVASTFDTLRHDIASSLHDWAARFDAARHNIADFAHNVAAHFDEIRHTIAAWAADVGRLTDRAVTFFRELPGKILHALAALPGELFRMGQQVVMGFVRGIESMIGSVVSAAEHMISSLGGKVLKLLGISSPSKVAHWWGEMIAQGLADGIRHNAHLPAGAAAAMVSGIGVNLASIPGWGQIPGAGGVAPVRVQLEWAGGDSPIFTALREGIRVRGGNVQSVLGHG